MIFTKFRTICMIGELRQRPFFGRLKTAVYFVALIDYKPVSAFE